MNNGKSTFFAKLVSCLLSVYLLLPLVVILIYSLFSDWSTSVLPSGFTLKYYGEIFSDSGFWSCMVRTIVISIVPILISTVVLLLAMYVIILYIPKAEKYIQILCMIPYAIQGVILSVSIISIYTGTGTFLSNRVLMLVGAYCILILPYVFQGIRNNLYGINAITLIEAAQMLGTTKLYAFFKIVVPNIISGITVSSLLSMSMIFGDFVLANNIAGTSYKNIQVYLQQAMKFSSGKSSAIVVCIFVVVFSLTGVVLALQAPKKEKRPNKKVLKED